MSDGKVINVLCDTNVAVLDCHLFRIKEGQGLLNILRAKRGKLVVPEVLKSEYIKHYILGFEKAIVDSRKSLGIMKSYAGDDLAPLLPHTELAQTQALHFFKDHADVIHLVPTTDALKIAAVERSMSERAPTSKTDHGLKDCLIWESLLSIPRGSEVIFVSRDKGFFQNGALHPDLQRDCQERELQFSAVYSDQQQGLTPTVRSLRDRFTDLDAAPVLHEGAVDGVGADFQPRPEARAAPLPADLPAPPVETKGVEVVPMLSELDVRLANARVADLKALGFVSFFRSKPKRFVTSQLALAGMPIDVATNALQRLALHGLIRETAHHYLSISDRLSEMAAEVVEPDIIELIQGGA